MGVFFRYERLCFSGGILTANHSKAAVCHFRVTKKRRIATTLLSCSAYFVAGVLGIPLVHYVEERGEVVILWFVAVHAVIDCDKAYLLLGEQNLGIKADLKIVSAETAHILDDNRADFPGFGFCKHCLKSGTVEVTPCVTVIFQKIVCKKFIIATVYKGNIIKNLIMDCQSYTKYRPNETTGGIFVSWRRKEELPTGA